MAAGQIALLRAGGSGSRGVELKPGDRLRFVASTQSKVACRYYLDWEVVRLWKGLDERAYVRLTAVADPAVTKLVLLASLAVERFVVTPCTASPAETNGAASSLPLRSRQARAVTLAVVAGTAD